MQNVDFLVDLRYTISMNTLKRVIFVMLLGLGLVALSFGDTFYSFTTGLYRMGELYSEEDFNRDYSGINAIFNVTCFPKDYFLGFFVQTSFSGVSSGFESDGENITPLDSNGWDIRASLGPSFKLQPGAKLRIPLSIGPAFALYREEAWGTWDDDYTDTFYEAFNMGLFADAALIFNPSRWFFLKHGVSVEWDFLRTERGTMDSSYRTNSSGRFKVSPYQAILASIYFGIGIRFE